MRLTKEQLNLIANTCAEIAAQKARMESILLRADLPDSDKEVVLGLAEVRATDLIMIRNLL